MGNANATVILTGATGFLGSRLLRSMVASNYTVIVLKRSGSVTWRIDDLLDRTIVYDIDRVPLREIFSEWSADALVHAATSYGRKGEMASQIIESNLLFPIKLYELCGEFDVETFFNVDTFFNTSTVLPEGLNEYVLSKKHLIEYVIRSEYQQKVRFANMRLEHMYGPYDDEKKFVPYLVKSLIEEQPAIDLTAGDQRRDFIYIDDAVNAILTLLRHRAQLHQPFSQVGLGTGKSESLRRFVELAHRLSNSRSILNFGRVPYRQGEIMESYADTGMLASLGWSPSVSLTEGIEKTIEEMRTRRSAK